MNNTPVDITQTIDAVSVVVEKKAASVAPKFIWWFDAPIFAAFFVSIYLIYRWRLKKWIRKSSELPQSC